MFVALIARMRCLRLATSEFAGALCRSFLIAATVGSVAFAAVVFGNFVVVGIEKPERTESALTRARKVTCRASEEWFGADIQARWALFVGV